MVCNGECANCERHSIPEVEHNWTPVVTDPYSVLIVGSRFCAYDERTGNKGTLRLTHIEAEQDIASIKLRNMMHG